MTQVQIITCTCPFTSIKASFARLQVSSNINTIPSSSATSSFDDENTINSLYGRKNQSTINVLSKIVLLKIVKTAVSQYTSVVSWTKGLRYRPNHKQCRESRGIVGYINVSSVFFLSGQFRGKGLRDPGHGRFRDTCAIGREKTKRC